jgi:hypothetical protein
VDESLVPTYASEVTTSPALCTCHIDALERQDVHDPVRLETPPSLLLAASIVVPFTLVFVELPELGDFPYWFSQQGSGVPSVQWNELMLGALV